MEMSLSARLLRAGKVMESVVSSGLYEMRESPTVSSLSRGHRGSRRARSRLRCLLVLTKLGSQSDEMR